MKTNRRELADFLRRTRDRLTPEQVGLPRWSRRRTPGLRREEVAQAAGISTDYYTRLEQARGPQPSEQILAATARALRLTEDERDHLYLLAGRRPPAGGLAGDHVSPALLHLLDRLVDTPAQVISDLGDVLAQNDLARSLLGGVCTVSEHGRNIVWRWFSDTAARAAYPPEDWEYLSRVHVADLRAAVARRADDAASARLVERLRAASTEFADLWDLHEVGVRRHSRMHVSHPQVGGVELECDVLLSPERDQRLVLLTPAPGTAAHEKIGLLRVVGDESFEPAAPWDEPAFSPLR